MNNQRRTEQSQEISKFETEASCTYPSVTMQTTVTAEIQHSSAQLAMGVDSSKQKEEQEQTVGLTKPSIWTEAIFLALLTIK